ncbi:MAG TPA: metallophosphoesterase [Clostridia bacterium]|nr:metallophosphoesterase [Clostridia bacterium]
MDFSTRFAVFADLHVDIMHDGVARVQAICEAAKESGAQFILHLGDIQYPEAAFLRAHAPESLEKRQKHAWFVCDRDDEKEAVRALLRETGLPVYGVLGNHDMDSCDKRTACLYWGMPGPCYGFTAGGVRFLALDTNFLRTPEGCADYDHCNYRYATAKDTTFLPEAQLSWLESEILASREPCVLLSHAPLGDDLLSVQNREDVWALLAQVNRDKRRVILALNGHNHVDGLSVRQGVPFLSVNSASNIWIGHRYAAVRYSQTIRRMYPHMAGCAPYRDALFAIVTIDEKGINIQGTRTGFVGPSPQALGFPEEASYHTPAPVVRDRSLPLTAIPGDGRVL